MLRDEAGQVLLETAIVLPVLLLVVLGLIYLCVLFNDGLVHRYLTFKAVREAAVSGGDPFYAQSLYTALHLWVFRGGGVLDVSVENGQVTGHGTLARYVNFPRFLRWMPGVLYQTKYRFSCSPKDN